MMISPEAYYEEYIKDKSLPEIKHNIRCLKLEMGRLKSDMANGIADWNYHPSPETKLSCLRDYLSYTREMLLKEDVDIPLSQNEKRAEEFQQRIEHIKTITYRIWKKESKRFEVEYFLDLSVLPLEFWKCQDMYSQKTH